MINCLIALIFSIVAFYVTLLPSSTVVSFEIVVKTLIRLVDRCVNIDIQCTTITLGTKNIVDKWSFLEVIFMLLQFKIGPQKGGRSRQGVVSSC